MSYTVNRPRLAFVRVGFAVALLFQTLTPAATAQGSPQDAGIATPRTEARSALWWTAVARVLAGMEPDRPEELGALLKRASIVKHQGAFAGSWEPFYRQRLAPVQAFSARELAGFAEAAGPVFYPFSGPDALYALAMFPQASELVLTGLEPVGLLPDPAKLDEKVLAASLAELRRSLNAVLSVSFFKTNDMRAELRANRFSGVTPIILIFLARHGFEVRAVEPFTLERDLSLKLVPEGALRNLGDERVAGVRVTFQRPEDAKERRLYYFNADISDQGLERTPQYLQWMSGFTPRATFVKSASYLMHKPYFSRVRQFVLDRAALVVQDDSGVPLRFFPEAAWDRRLYGAYAKPISLFANWYQKDMRAAYAKGARPLEFGIGYQFARQRSNLQVFMRRGAAQRAGTN